ncbi:HRDC domain-containing protein, partial [uncultured Oscillibacter sp.]|uniref:HRDC domain-containing protein n=1 Tax=uncultured Oscillibacter sp. TaxID=876091 RepID=UPI00261B9ED6
ELFGRLRALRAQLARRQGVPAYVVFSDKTLREMAISRPRTMAELRAVSGVGAAKAERYGRDFLAVIRDFPS